MHRYSLNIVPTKTYSVFCLLRQMARLPNHKNRYLYYGIALALVFWRPSSQCKRLLFFKSLSKVYTTSYWDCKKIHSPAAISHTATQAHGIAFFAT